MTQKTVSEVAALGGVSVRTLHYYDEIGLLAPSERSEAGYRLYTEPDLRRLHDIRLWRSLGFPLEEIRALLDAGGDPTEALLLHRDRLLDDLKAVAGRISALDAVIRKTCAVEPLGDDDLVALFDGFDPAEHEQEVAARWGGTDAYEQSRQRTRRYSAAQWAAIKAEMQAIESGFAALLLAGAAPGSAEARAAAASHQAHISRWFYDCTPEIHAGLAEMYTDDERFSAHYERVAAGLAVFVRDAIRALHAPQERTL